MQIMGEYARDQVRRKVSHMNGFMILLLLISSGWKASDNPFIRETIRDACFVNDQEGWIVTEEGSIFHTQDGGRSWMRQAKTDTMLCSVHFINPDRGWASGVNLILSTEDGGGKWEKHELRGYNLLSIEFADEQRGWAVGTFRIDRGVILSTTDGGREWKEYEGDVPGWLFDLSLISPEVGWATGMIRGWTTKPLLLHTDDGGRSWHQVKIGIDGMESLVRVYLLTRRRGWLIGRTPSRESVLLTTRDGGGRWEVSWKVKANLLDLFFIDGLRGWVVGDEGLIFHTEDGGLRWERQRSGVEGALRRIAYTGGDRLVAIGEGGVMLFYRDPSLRRLGFQTLINLRAITWGGIKK